MMVIGKINGKALLALLCLPVLVIVGWYAFRDFEDKDTNHKWLASLNSDEVLSIVIGHQVVDNPESIRPIVELLRANDFIDAACVNRGVNLTVNLRDGHKLRCDLSRALEKETSDAVLSFARGGPYETNLHVKGLVGALSSLGIDLPGSGYPRITYDGKIIQSLDTNEKVEANNAPFTLFSIERSPILDDRNSANGYIIGCLVFLTFALHIIFLVTGVWEKKERSIKNIAIAIIFMLVLLSVAWDFGKDADQMIRLSKQYRALRKSLQDGKCHTITGNLTDVKYNLGPHGSIFLDSLEVSGHKFYFAGDEVNKELCNRKSWEQLVSEKLQVGKKVSVWYETIPDWNDVPEHIAKIDILN